LAQNARFTYSGTIEFEKTVNMYELIKKTITKGNELVLQEMLTQYKASQPQMKITKSVLTFSNDKTLFQPVDNSDNAPQGFARINVIGQQPNIVFTNLPAHKYTTQKRVFEDVLLLDDSLKKVKWKLTSETRDIAGYKCRRANALIMDSVYVVAFYAEDIPVSGGPESFTGLPGMILGVALPHENTSWFATKVNDMNVRDNILTAPTKGKKITKAGLSQILQSESKNWGYYSQLYLKTFSL